MPCENLKLGVHLARASQDCRRREDPINTLDTFAGCLHFLYQCPGLAFLWKLLHTVAGEAILLPHVIVRAVSHPWTTRGMRVCYSRCSPESFVLTISFSPHNQHIAQIILLHPSVVKHKTSWIVKMWIYQLYLTTVQEGGRQDTVLGRQIGTTCQWTLAYIVQVLRPCTWGHQWEQA